MLYHFIEIPIAVLCSVLYVVLTIQTKRKQYMEKKNEVTVYQPLYYKRLAFEIIGDGAMVAFLIYILQACLFADIDLIHWWCPLYGTAAKYLNLRDNF